MGSPQEMAIDTFQLKDILVVSQQDLIDIADKNVDVLYLQRRRARHASQAHYCFNHEPQFSMSFFLPLFLPPLAT